MNDNHVLSYHEIFGLFCVCLFFSPSRMMDISNQENCNVKWANSEELSFLLYFQGPLCLSGLHCPINDWGFV